MSLRRARQLGDTVHIHVTLVYSRAFLGVYDEFDVSDEALAAVGSSSTALVARSKLLERVKLLERKSRRGLAHRRVRGQPPAEVF